MGRIRRARKPKPNPNALGNVELIEIRAAKKVELPWVRSLLARADLPEDLRQAAERVEDCLANLLPANGRPTLDRMIQEREKLYNSGWLRDNHLKRDEWCAAQQAEKEKREAQEEAENGSGRASSPD